MACGNALIPLILIFSSSIAKTRVLNDALSKYTIENSTPLPTVLAEFLYDSVRLPHGMMTSSGATVNLLMGLLRVIRAEKVLDVGTYAGFSAVGMATALPSNGKVITLDVTDYWWNLIGKNYSNKAKVSSKVEKHLTTPADTTLSELIRTGSSGQFDLCYIDADKLSYELYFEKCLTLLRPLGIIAMDNVLWSGDVAADGAGTTKDVITKNFVKLNAKIAADQRVWTNIVTVGDGLSISVKRP